MFKKYPGVIDITEVLMNEHNYLFDGNLEKFYKQPFIELEGNGVTAMCWIKVKDDSYLFKPINEPLYNVWGELLSEEFAKKLDISCAEYRLAQFDGKLGVITKQILKEDERLILGCEVFQEFLNEYFSPKNDKKSTEMYQISDEILEYDAYHQKRYLFNHFNNIEQIWAILDKNKKISSEDKTKIIQDMIKLLLFDIITIQGDRHPNNWALKTDGKTYQLSPIFDNATSFGLCFPNMQNRINNFRNDYMHHRYFNDIEKINKTIYQSRPNLTLSEDNIIEVTTRKKDSPIKVLDDLLKKSDENWQNKIIELSKKINIDLLDEIIEKVESKNGLTMDGEIYSYIRSVFEIHLENINTILNKYQKGSEKDGSNANIRRI